jgi:DNA-binding beta-propeller fold protein YncE
VGLVVAAVAGCDPYVGPVAATGELHTPVGLAVHPSGDWVYVLSSNFEGNFRVNDGGSVDIIDAEQLTLVEGATVRVPSYGARLAFGGDATAPDRLYAATRSSDAVIALSVSADGSALTCNGALLSDGCSIGPFPGDPYDVVEVAHEAGVDGVRTIAVASLAGSVSMADVRGNAFDAASIRSRGVVGGSNNVVLLPGFDELLAAGRFSNTLVNLTWYRGASGDVAAIVPLRTMSIASPSPSSEVRDIALSSDQTLAWVTAARPGAVQLFDVSRDSAGNIRGRFLARFDLDGAPADVVLVEDGEQPVLYVSQPDLNSIAVIDALSGTYVDSIYVGGLPFALAADVNVRKRLYVTLFDANAVAVIDIDPSSSSFRRVIGRVESLEP